MRAAGVVLPFADGSGRTVTSPFEIDGVRKRAPGPAPRLGQHGDEVLAQAGYSADEIAALRAAGVLL
jgi:formyl-CoA transferase